MTTKTYQHYLFGITLSILLAGGIATLSITAITNPMLGWGIVVLLNAAILVGAPLAILLLIVWVTYMVRDRGRMPGRVHALLFLPTLLALLIYPASQSIERRKNDQFTAASPPIAETHVNLSGKDLWIDTKPYASTYSGAGPVMPLAASKSERFMAFTRYPNADFIASGAFPYEGPRMKENIARYSYQLASGEVAFSLPLNRLSYPDLTPFFPILGEDEASMLRYLYFHYPDHVDVAPTLQHLAGMTEQYLEEKKLKGLVLFKAQNYAPGAIARLEINGYTLSIGDRALKSTAPLPAPCSDTPTFLSGAFVDLDQPLDIRWQTLDEPQTWHTTTLRIPAFRQPQPMDGESTLLRAQLYFLPDGTVQGERFVEVRLSQEQLGIRTTGMPAQAADYASCGSAFSYFNPQVVRLLED